MAQTVLNFSIAPTDERLTSKSGEIVFGEYLKAVGVDKLCDTYLPQPGSNRGYAPFNFIQPLLLMLHSGGHSLDEIYDKIKRNNNLLNHVYKGFTASFYCLISV